MAGTYYQRPENIGTNGGRVTATNNPYTGQVTTTRSDPYSSAPPTATTYQTRPAYRAPAPPPATNTTGGDGNNQPDPFAEWKGIPEGWGEQWYEKNANQWDNPSQSAQYWNGVQGWFNGPGQGESALNGYANDLNAPNALDSAWDTLKGQYQQPGAAENFYDLHSGDLMNGSQIGDYYNSNKDQFQQGGAMEKAFGDLYGRASQDGALMQHQGDVTRDINSARGTDQWMRQNQGALNGPGYTEQSAMNYSPVQGYSEGLMQSGAGLDDLYARQFDVGSRRLDNAAAARGGFNSGAALRSQEELNRDLSADQIKQTIALADQADKYRMGERQFGLQTATSADQAMQARLGLGLQGAGQSDTTALGRAGATEGLYKNIEDQRQSGIQLAGNLARDTQASALARLMGGANVANLASEDQVNRFNSTSTAANQAQAAALNRTNSGLAAANNVGRLRLDTTKTQGDFVKNAQDLALARFLGGNTIASTADSAEQQRLISAQAAANSAQNIRQNRIRGNFQDADTLATQQANTYLQGMDPARREQFQSSLSQINATLSRGQIDQSAADAQIQQLFASMGLGISAYSLYKNNPNAFTGQTPATPPGMPRLPTTAGDNPLAPTQF